MFFAMFAAGILGLSCLKHCRAHAFGHLTADDILSGSASLALQTANIAFSFLQIQ